jgi:Pilin (bacterial filament)
MRWIIALLALVVLVFALMRLPNRRLLTVLAVGVAASAVLDAHANTGIGLLVLAVPVTVVGLVPAIFIEAPILARLLRVRGGRALWLSCVANVLSTIVGFVVALVTSFVPLMYGEFMRETVLISMVPMFFLTWWIENLSVKRMLPAGSERRSMRATGVANVVSYVVLAVGVAILVPPESAIFNRWRVAPAINALGIAKNDVAEHFQSHGAFPAPGPIKQHEPTVKSMVLDKDGRLVATLSFPGRPAGDGKHIVYEPVLASGKITAWKCSSDMESRYLPVQCR